jgi:hypothetical protein
MIKYLPTNRIVYPSLQDLYALSEDEYSSECNDSLVEFCDLPAICCKQVGDKRPYDCTPKVASVKWLCDVRTAEFNHNLFPDTLLVCTILKYCLLRMRGPIYYVKDSTSQLARACKEMDECAIRHNPFEVLVR